MEKLISLYDLIRHMYHRRDEYGVEICTSPDVIIYYGLLSDDAFITKFESFNGNMCYYEVTDIKTLEDKVVVQVSKHDDMPSEDPTDKILNERRNNYLKLAEMFKRFLSSDEVWKDIKFGTDENRLYIDGVINYADEEEKRLINEIVHEKDIK